MKSSINNTNVKTFGHGIVSPLAVVEITTEYRILCVHIIAVAFADLSKLNGSFSLINFHMFLFI